MNKQKRQTVTTEVELTSEEVTQILINWANEKCGMKGEFQIHYSASEDFLYYVSIVAKETVEMDGVE